MEEKPGQISTHKETIEAVSVGHAVFFTKGRGRGTGRRLVGASENVEPLVKKKKRIPQGLPFFLLSLPMDGERAARGTNAPLVAGLVPSRRRQKAWLASSKIDLKSCSCSVYRFHMHFGKETAVHRLG